MRMLALTALLFVGTHALAKEAFVSVCDRHPGVIRGLVEATSRQCDQIDSATLSQIGELTVRAKISELRASDFQGLNELWQLSLRNSDNTIGKFPKNLFENIRSVSFLTIVNARFTSLSQREFAKLDRLTYLDFDNCSVGTLEPGFFATMSNLQGLEVPAESLVNELYPFKNLDSLAISGRDSNHLSKNFFLSFERLAFLGLERVSLDGAPIDLFSTLSGSVDFELIDADLKPFASGQIAWPKQIGTLYLSFKEAAPVLPPGLFDHGSFSINRIRFFSSMPLEHIPDNYFVNIKGLKEIDVFGSPLTKTSKSAINGVPRVLGLPVNFGVTETGGTTEEWAP